MSTEKLLDLHCEVAKQTSYQSISRTDRRLKVTYISSARDRAQIVLVFDVDGSATVEKAFAPFSLSHFEAVEQASKAIKLATNMGWELVT